MQLWSSVEKDREAAEAQRARHAERQRRLQEQRETKVAPLSSGAAAGGGSDHAARWQRLDPMEDEEAGPADEAAAREAHAPAAAGAGEAAAGRSGQQDPEALGRGLLSDGAVSSSDGLALGEAGDALEELPLHDEGAAPEQQVAAAGQRDVEAGSGGWQASGPPPAQQQQQQQQWDGDQQSDDEDKACQGATPSASSAGGGQWQSVGEQHQPVTARHGAGQAGFWRTFRDMLGDIHIVACGPERRALLVGGLGVAWLLPHSGFEQQGERCPLCAALPPCLADRGAGAGSLLGPLPDRQHATRLLPCRVLSPVHLSRPAAHPWPCPLSAPADVALAGLLQPGIRLDVHHQLCTPGKAA